MPNAIRFHEPGGPEVLVLEPVPIGKPGPGEARVRHTAVGVNFVDILQVGRYATPALLTARAVLRPHRIPPDRSPSPRGVRARESEMPARTECGCRRRRAAVALS